MYIIKAKDITGRIVEAHYDKVPDKCPICHDGIVAIPTEVAFISARISESDWTGYLEIGYRCPKADCCRLFIGLYRQVVQTGGDRSWFFFATFFPNIPKPPDIPDAIRNVSPRFVMKSAAARCAGLWNSW
jgi:hypothetical protein